LIITINGYQLPNIYVGSTYKQSLEDELDSLAIVYQDDSKPAFNAHDIAIVDNQKWVVGSYVSELVARAPKKYRITLFLVELTKLLERFILGPCAYTQKNDTLKDQVLKALKQAEPLRDGESEKFVLSTELDSILAQTTSEEFFFNSQMTLREILDTMFASLNYRVVLTDVDNDGFYYLHFMDLNQQSEDIKPLEDIVNESENQSMEYLAGNYETKLSQVMAADESDLIYEEPQTLKPVNLGAADTTGMILTTSRPIEKISYLGCYFKSEYHVNMRKYEYNQNIDVTDLLIEKELFDTMSKPEQEARIPFVRGQNNIGILDSYKAWFFTYIKIYECLIDRAKAALDAYLTANNITPDNNIQYVPSEEDIFTDVLFQIIYFGYKDIHYKQGKGNVLLENSSMISNQTEEKISISRQGGSLRALANKLGNKVYEVDVNLSGSTVEELQEQLLKRGDRIAGDYTLVSREYSIFETITPFVKCHYTFMQHYSNVLATKLSRERRLYKIPLVELVERDILLKDYLIVGSSSVQANNGILSDEIATKYFLRTFDPNDDTNDPLERLLVTAYDKYNNEIVGIYSLKFVGSSIGNSMHWSAEFMDNFSVGLSLTAKHVWGGYEVFSNPYTDQNGETTRLKLRLCKSSMSEMMTLDEQLELGQQLPYVPWEFFNGIKTVYTKRDYTRNNLCNIAVYKDAYEKLSISYQLEVRPRTADFGKIIIGDALTKYANLLYGTNGTALYIWYSNNETYRLSDKRCKGIRTISNPHTYDNQSIYCIYFVRDPELSNAKSWAIGTISGELLIGVNEADGNHINRLYFTISRNVI
jgi:hypothetical protein